MTRSRASTETADTTAQEGVKMASQPLPYHPTPKRSSGDDSGRRNRQQIATCGRCDARWTGLNAAHCSACHRTFTSVSAFDAHRTGSHARGTRHCLDPESVGLVPANRPWPGWSLPGRWEGPR